MLQNKCSEEKVDSLLSKCQIPIIDLAHVGTDECPVKSVVNRVGSQLHKALSEKGLAFLVNHGIAEEKFKKAWSYLDAFCELPTDVKELYIRKSTNNHGYTKPGQEGFDGKTPQLRHAFNICTLSGASLPEEPLPGFRAHIVDLAKDYKNLAGLLLQALAISLNLSPCYFMEKHSHMLSGNDENETTLRLLYYPPLVEDDNKCELVKGRCQYSYQRCTIDKPDWGIPATPDTDLDAEDDPEILATRCGTHCDYGTFTLLAQDSEGGLEAKIPGTERWQRIGHLPGSILINTGELLSVWTQQKFAALPHRVVIPEQQAIRSRGRHSMAFFCHPDNCEAIEPIQLADDLTTTCTDGATKKKGTFKTAKNKVFTAYHHIQRRFKETYAS